MAINPHHLELFHYVARHGGIAQASKNMPYGIGQSAISLQIARLESHLGVTLFQRRPFKLSPEGLKLHAQTEPFFRALDRIETEFRGGAAPMLRIGATEIIQRDHLPAVFDTMRRQKPGIRFSIRDTDPVSLAALVRSGELDAAVCLYSENPPAEPVSLAFQMLLAKQGRVWEPSLELGSLPLIHKYVLDGYGIGLAVDEPGLPVPAGLRLLPVPDAPALVVTVIHNGRPNPLRDMLLAVARTHTEAMKAAAATPKAKGKKRA